VYTLMHEFELKPSRRLGLLLLGMAVLALFAIWLAALPGAVQLALAVFVIVISVWRGRQARFTQAMRLQADGQLQYRDASGEWNDLEVLGDSLVSPACVVLRYRTADRRKHTRVLLADSADADALRRLRVSLRWIRRTRSDTAFPDAG
jgi:toxin CptA